MSGIITPKPKLAEVMELPDQIKGAERADKVLTEQDRNRKERPEEEEGWRSLAIPQPKEKGIEIEAQYNRILVKFDGNVIAVIRWLSQSHSFHVKRRQPVMGGGTRLEEYRASFSQAWEAAAAYGVTALEFQAAFIDMPVPGEWRFDLCPRQRKDCQLRLTDGALGGIPGLTCKTCGSKFSLDRDGQVKLESTPEPEPAPAPQKSVPETKVDSGPDRFDQEFLGADGMGPAKLRSVKEAGMGSWKKLAEARPQDIACLKGFSARTATSIHAVAKLRMELRSYGHEED